jgi:peptidyl-prolyl cis-trans isomerase SurA
MVLCRGNSPRTSWRLRPPRKPTGVLLGFIASLLPVVGTAQSDGSAAIPIDRIVVIVNDDVITDSELAARLADVERELAERKIQMPPKAILEKQVLERMVLERIQLQHATRVGVRVSERDIDRAVGQVAKRNRMTSEELYQALRSLGVEQQAYRRQLRDQVMIEKLLEREINNRVTVTDSEVDDFLANLRKQARVDDAFDISHILIGVPEGASPKEVQEAKRKADEVRDSLLAGGNFEEAALVYSQGQEALKGGALGWKKAGQLPALFLDALERLQPGEISEVLRSPVGFHILKLNDRQAGKRSAPVTQTHARQILMRPSEIQSISDIRTRLEGLRERALLGDDFADLARAHSEDAGSAARGGDLGWVLPGQTVPEFEKAMNELEPGEISQPVESPFGVHLIQVLERRVQDMSEERDRNAARQQIHARKADEQYEQWLRRLRDEAYVEHKEGVRKDSPVSPAS